MSQHPIEGMLGTSMEKIREMIDVNAIIGEPILTPDGTVVIPVSKVSFGFGSGGSDFPAKVEKDLFGGGAGAGVSIQPLAFLVLSGSDVKLLQMSENGTATDKLFEAVPEVIDKISEVFSKKKKEAKEEK